MTLLHLSLPLFEQTIGLACILPSPLQTVLRSGQLTQQFIVILLQQSHIGLQSSYHVLLNPIIITLLPPTRINSTPIFTSFRRHFFSLNRPVFSRLLGATHVASVGVFLVGSRLRFTLFLLFEAAGVWLV